MQDYIAMVLLWYSTQAMTTSNLPAISNDMLEVLNKMEVQLDKVL